MRVGVSEELPDQFLWPPLENDLNAIHGKNDNEEQGDYTDAANNSKQENQRQSGKQLGKHLSRRKRPARSGLRLGHQRLKVGVRLQQIIGE